MWKPVVLYTAKLVLYVQIETSSMLPDKYEQLRTILSQIPFVKMVVINYYVEKDILPIKVRLVGIFLELKFYCSFDTQSIFVNRDSVTWCRHLRIRPFWAAFSTRYSTKHTKSIPFWQLVKLS